MTAQIKEKIPPGKACPRFYLSERRHEIWPGKNVYLLILVYFTYFFYKEELCDQLMSPTKIIKI